MRQLKGSLLRVLFAFAGHCPKEVNYHWFSCDCSRPKGARNVWGRSVEWDCLQAFPSLDSPSPSAPHFSYSLPVPFSSGKVLETPATQAKKMRSVENAPSPLECQLEEAGREKDSQKADAANKIPVWWSDEAP